MWAEVCQTVLLTTTLWAHQKNRQVRLSELCENLQAQTARRGWWFRFRDDYDCLKLPRARGDSCPKSDSFGANRAPKTPILDVAANKNPIAFHQHGRTHMKTTIGGIGALANLGCGLD